MTKSGGGMPRFENVVVEGLTVEKEYGTPGHSSDFATRTSAQAEIAQMQPQVHPQQPSVVAPSIAAPVLRPTPTATPPPQVSSRITVESSASSPKKDIYPILIVAVVAILAIGGVSYFAYITFFNGSTSQQPSSTTTQTPAQNTAPLVATTTASSSPSATSNTSATTPASMELAVKHVSLFKKPADQIITITLTTSNSTNYRKAMVSSLAEINPASSMIEIDPQANDGKNLNISGLLAAAASTLLNSQVLADFNPDATFYVYRDSNGTWPGYILELSSGETQTAVAASVKQLEQSSNIGNVFLTDPGTPSSDGFTDTTIASLPVRVLPFEGIAAPSYFTYGWDGNYLILSTSQNGFAAAVANLE
jgi:flagellar basal body-associated protein FliL